jgi:hypothetical protein
MPPSTGTCPLAIAACGMMLHTRAPMADRIQSRVHARGKGRGPDFLCGAMPGDIRFRGSAANGAEPQWTTVGVEGGISAARSAFARSRHGFRPSAEAPAQERHGIRPTAPMTRLGTAASASRLVRGEPMGLHRQRVVVEGPHDQGRGQFLHHVDEDDQQRRQDRGAQDRHVDPRSIPGPCPTCAPPRRYWCSRWQPRVIGRSAPRP